MDSSELLAMRQRTDPADRSGLADLGQVEIDPSQPIEQRWERLIGAVHNPYCFTVDGIVVQLEFSHGERSLEEAVKAYLEALRST